MKLKVEMALTSETAQRFKEAGQRLFALHLGVDAELAAAVLIHIAEDYERAREAMEAGTIPSETLNAENDE